MVEMLEHPPLADDIPHALGPYNCYTTSASSPVERLRVDVCCQQVAQLRGAGRLTFILPYVLESKGEASVLALDDAHLAEGALADDSQQPEVVQVDCGQVLVSKRASPGGCGEGRGGVRSQRRATS